MPTMTEKPSSPEKELYDPNNSAFRKNITSDVPLGIPREPAEEKLQRLHDSLETLPKEPPYIDPLATYESFCPEDDQGDNLGFKPALVAQWLNANFHFKTDRVTEKMFYGDAATGKWSKKGEIKLQQFVTKMLGQEDRASHYKNILHTLKGLSYTDIVFSEKLAVENGILNPETLEFTEPTLDEMVYYQLPVDYNPDAKKLENWLEFLKQVVKPDDIPLLQEWAGYLLLPDHRFHIALWIHGEGRNGKGVFDRTLQGILGKDNVAKVGLEELDGSHRFVLSQYYGKLYAVSSEPATNKIFRTEIFQKITGGDAIGAELKGANDRLEFTNCAKLTIIGNKFPKIHNPTTAFKDRMKFVEFPIYFAEKDRIPNLENVWLNDPEQKSAIFNWMLEGLQRLLQQGYFTESKTQKETEILFQRTSDTISAFQNELGLIDKNLVTIRTDAFFAYQEYCDALGIDAENKNNFTQQMQKLAPKVKDGWTRITGKPVRAWLGFGLKSVENSESEQSQQLQQLRQQNTLAQSFKINLKKEESINSVAGVAGVTESKVKSRYCMDECKNFCTARCTAPNLFDRSDNAELPLKCPGYCYVGTGEIEE